MKMHTLAPWLWENGSLKGRSENIHTIINDEGCMVYRDVSVEDFTLEIEANRRLIAAAPDLLDALKLAEDFMSGFEDDDVQEGINVKLATIRAAIALAETQS